MFSILTPALKSEKMTVPNQETSMKGGQLLEPFVALINHSCEANADWIFEGKELRVRASQDITAGQEITFSYMEYKGDYDIRREFMMKIWGINCTCAFC
jgi:SET domain-containing protein